jgi:nucleotide-binding universal stress UspA family protein
MNTHAELSSSFHIGALVKPNHILVATDLSDVSTLVPHVVAQAKASNARVTLVHAILPANVYPGDFALAAQPDQEALSKNARLLLQRIVSQIAAQGVRCDFVVEHGYAAEVISEQVKLTGATRLVVGSHGRGKFGQMVLGSVTNSLLGQINIPIFAVGPEIASAPLHVTPRRILHPTSLIGDYRPSLEIAMEVARFYKATLRVLHIIEVDGLTNECRDRAISMTERAIRSTLAKMGAENPEIEVKVSDDGIVEEILDASAEIAADWIVLGVSSAFRPPFHNSFAYKIIAQSACGVLVVRHEPDARNETTVVEEQFSSVMQ